MKPPTAIGMLTPARIDADQLSKLPLFITKVRPDAEKIVAQGDFVRAKAREGCGNSALACTVEGSLAAARQFIAQREADANEPETPWLFGQNIREAIRALRPLFRK